MRLIWDEDAWDDYLYWQNQDKKTLKRINKLITDSQRNGYTGIGKPEMLDENLSGFCSKRIDDKNRLVYRVSESGLEIAQCGSHYRDK
jgi:toxin YoeB